MLPARGSPASPRARHASPLHLQREKLEAGIKDGTLKPGHRYREMIETVRKALGNLKAEFPQYDGQGCEVAYHYLGSAKILSLIGYGCAEAMKGLGK